MLKTHKWKFVFTKHEAWERFKVKNWNRKSATWFIFMFSWHFIKTETFWNIFWKWTSFWFLFWILKHLLSNWWNKKLRKKNSNLHIKFKMIKWVRMKCYYCWNYGKKIVPFSITEAFSIDRICIFFSIDIRCT